MHKRKAATIQVELIGGPFDGLQDTRSFPGAFDYQGELTPPERINWSHGTKLHCQSGWRCLIYVYDLIGFHGDRYRYQFHHWELQGR